MKRYYISDWVEYKNLDAETNTMFYAQLCRDGSLHYEL